MDSPPPPPPPPPPQVLERAPPPPPPRVVISSSKPRVIKVSRPSPKPSTARTRVPRRTVPPRSPSSGKGFVITKIIVISFLLLLLALILVPQLRDSPLQWLNPLSYRQFPETAEFTVERQMSISGVKSFGFDIPEPGDISGAQQLVSIYTFPQPTSLQKYGYDWMDWNAPPGETITVRTTFRTWTVWWDIDSGNSLTLSEARSYDPVFNILSDQYNHDEWRIETTHPDIVSLARQLEVNGGTIYENLQSIFRYLDVNFEYSTREGGAVKTSSETLRDRHGDCDDMSFLFVSLARAMGIPSWPELGAMYNSITREWVGHGWMEVYVPTTKGGQNVSIDMVNDEFLIRGANRFSDFKSNGLGDHLEDYYYSYSYLPVSGMTPEISDNFIDRGYDANGSVTVKLGHDGSPVPLFEFLAILVAVIIGLVIISKVLKRRGRHRAQARR